MLAEALDAEGGDVDITDHAVFKQHARRYEAEFMRDMDDLGKQKRFCDAPLKPTLDGAVPHPRTPIVNSVMP